MPFFLVTVFVAVVVIWLQNVKRNKNVRKVTKKMGKEKINAEMNKINKITKRKKKAGKN